MILLILANILNAQSTVQFASITISNSYCTKYITEGRNNLETGGLSSLGVGLSYKAIELCLWYGNGLEEQYDEVQLSIGSSINWKAIKAAFGFTNLSFLHDDTKDQEIYLVLCYESLEWLTPFVTNTYSVEAEGSFLEFGVEFSLPLNLDKIEITPFVVEGIDLGYVEDAHGPNNTQFGINIRYLITDNLSLATHLCRSDGLWKENNNESHSWAGLTLQSSF